MNELETIVKDLEAILPIVAPLFGGAQSKTAMTLVATILSDFDSFAAGNPVSTPAVEVALGSLGNAKLSITLQKG